MKNRNWLDIAEYLMLFGSGVGSVASAASQQVLYSAAPLSFLMVLNLANRRRLQQRIEQDIPPAIAQLDQRIANEVEILNHKLVGFPTEEKMHALVAFKLAQQDHEGTITQLTEQVNYLRREIAKQTAPLKGHNLAAMQDTIQGIQERNDTLEALIDQLHRDLRQQVSANRVEALESLFSQVSEDVFNLQSAIGEVQENIQDLEDEQKLVNPRTLQDQIDHLNRRLSNLPQAFDASSLRKDVESLLSIVTDLVPRRELSRLLAELEKIHQQQSSLEQAVTVVRLASTVFRKQLDTLSVKLNVKEEALNWLTGAVAFQSEPQVSEEVKSSLAKLTKGLSTLQQQMKRLPPATDMAMLHQAVSQAVAVQVEAIQQELVDIRQVTQSLEAEQSSFHGMLHQLPESAAVLMWEQPLNTLAIRLEQTENELNALQAQIEIRVEQRLGELTQQSISELMSQQLQSLSQQIAAETVQQYLAEWGQQSINEIALQQLQSLSQQVAEETVQRRLAELSQRSLTGFNFSQPIKWGSPLSLQRDGVDPSSITTIEDLETDEETTQSGMGYWVMPDLATLMNEFEQIVAAQLDEVRQQVVNVQQTTHLLEQEQNTLRSLVSPSVAETLEQQRNALATRVEWAENNLGSLQSVDSLQPECQTEGVDRAIPSARDSLVEKTPLSSEEVPTLFTEEESNWISATEPQNLLTTAPSLAMVTEDFSSEIGDPLTEEDFAIASEFAADPISAIEFNSEIASEIASNLGLEPESLSLAVATEFSDPVVTPDRELESPSVFGEWSALATEIDLPFPEDAELMDVAEAAISINPVVETDAKLEIGFADGSKSTPETASKVASQNTFETASKIANEAEIGIAIHSKLTSESSIAPGLSTELSTELELRSEVPSELAIDPTLSTKPALPVSTVAAEISDETIAPEPENPSLFSEWGVLASEIEAPLSATWETLQEAEATTIESASLSATELVDAAEPEAESVNEIEQELQAFAATATDTADNTLADFAEELTMLETQLQVTATAPTITTPDFSESASLENSVFPEDGLDNDRLDSAELPIDPLPPINGRLVLEAALDNSQERVIIVSPYPTPETIDDALIQKCVKALRRGVRVDIGWGHLADASRIRVPRCLYQPRLDGGVERGFLQSLLRQLAQIKKQHPDQFRFKILGTHENFVVCDRSFAGLGVHPMPIAHHIFPHGLAGLQTEDADVIQSLIERFDRATPDPDNADIYFNRGTTRYDLGDKQGAIADYTQALRIDSNNDVAYNNRGLSRYELGDQGGAIMDFNNALQLNPENAIAYFNRAAARTDLGDKLGCISDFSQAIRHQPNFALAYFYRGMSRMQVGNRVGAIEDYTEAIGFNAQDGMAYFYRGLAYFRSGDKVRAVADLKQAEQLFTQQKDTVNRQRVLQALKELEFALAEARKTGTSQQTNAWPL